YLYFFFSSRRRHTRLQGDWSSDVCSSDLLSGGWNNDPSFFAFTRLGQYHDALVQAGDDKKIWLTEFGYDSSPVAVPGYEYSTFEIGRASCRERVKSTVLTVPFKS